MAVELIKISLSILVLIVLVLVRVAFVTLIEQKLLRSVSVRVGPNVVGWWGILQPFADAVKLFLKEGCNLRIVNRLIYQIIPIFSLRLILILWVVVPFNEGSIIFRYRIIFFICVRGFRVYPILLIGWSSNCKYSILGRLRRVAQIVSYEARLVIILLRVVYIRGRLRIEDYIKDQFIIWNIFIFLPLCGVWLASALAETNRTPYDFSEGESELVSGFNTEYRSGGFTLIFMREYARILFIRVVFSVLFISSGYISLSCIIKSSIVACIFVWVRSTLPRFRYDKLIGLAWKRFLPLRLVFFVLYMSGGVVIRVLTLY